MTRHLGRAGLVVLVAAVAALGAGGVAAPASASGPAVFWVSDPVQPGEVVLVEGANWGASPQVALSWLRDDKPGEPGAGAPAVQKSATVAPLQVNASSLKFLIPASWRPGVYSFVVTSGSGKTATQLLDDPDPWWQQGDWGKEASPGGWLRVFGKCLSLTGKAVVALKGAGKTVTLVPTQQNQWSLNVTLPATLAAGEYETWVHNGCGGAAGWKTAGTVTIRPHPPLWKPDLFEVRDYGAVGNDAFEDTTQIQAALDAAGRNGGGIVVIPRGRFQINATLLVPRLVLIRGAGPELTQLYWRDRVSPLDALIQGTNSFGVEDLTVVATNHIGGVVADPGSKPGAGNVFLRRLHVRLNRFEQVQADEAGRRLLPMGGQGTHGTYAIFAGGENVQVTDCELFSSRSPFGFTLLKHALIAGNRCFQGDTAHGIGGEAVIFENNEVLGGPVARGGYEYVEKNLYFANNRIGSMALADAELFTTDGGNTAPVTLVAAEGNRFTLGEDVNWNMWTRNGSRGVALFITHGTGAGQYRYITSHQDRDVELDRPWTVRPDGNSVIMLCPYFTRCMLVDNEFHDGTIVQNFCWGMEWIYAGNKITRGGGIGNSGRGRVPNWYSQYFENEILVGSGMRGPWNDQPPTDSHLQVIGDGARGAVFRRNVLHNNARIEITQLNFWAAPGEGASSPGVQDVVVDHNTIREADVGVSVEGRSAGVLLWANRFERVVEPLRGIGDQVFMHPAERMLNRLAGEGLVPERLGANAAWQRALRRLEDLRAQDPASVAVAEGVRACQTELARTAASALPQGQSLALMQALTGVALDEACSGELQAVLAEGGGGAGETTVTAALPAWAGGVTLRLGLPPLPEWQSTSPAAMALAPGGTGSAIFRLTVPAGFWGKPYLPLTYTAQGAGWELRGEGRLQVGNGTPVAPNMVKEWMVVGPFEAELPGNLGQTVYPPERKLDIRATYPGARGPVRWQPAKLTASGSLDLTQLYGSREKGVAYGVAVLRATRPTTVALTTNGGSTYAAGVTYLDGQLLGVPFRYGIRKVSRTLSAGDHVLLVGTAQTGKTWQLGVQVEVDPAAPPGSVRVLPVAQFGEVPGVAPPGGPAVPEGRSLPFADGYDWKLVYDDDFNREKMGKDWVAHEPQAWFEGSSWSLGGGHLASKASSYWEYLTCTHPVSGAVRVEFDLTGAPDRIPESQTAVLLSPRNQVGGRSVWEVGAGAGYMASAGAHAKAYSLIRREKTVRSQPMPALGVGETRHVIAQFSPKRLLLVVDGEVRAEYEDPEWIGGLDAVSLLNGFGRDWVDNLRIYQAAP